METDPQVDDEMTPNSIPRWDGAKLAAGSMYNDPNTGTVDIEAYSPILGFKRNATGGGFIGGQSFVNYGGGVAFWAGGTGNGSAYSSYSIRAGNYNGTLGLAVDTSGRVGIGTATPGSLLHVKSTSGNVVVTADRDSAAVAAQFVLAQGAIARWLLVDRDSGALVGTQTRRFDIYDGIAATPRLSVDNSGNVGIGTPNPEHKLDVNGNIRASCYFDRNDINYYLNPNGDSRLANTYLSYIRNYGNLHVDGNVGIGTATPARLLDVRSTGTSYLTIRGNNAGGNAAILEFYDTTSAHNWQIGMGDTDLDNDLKFYKGTDGLAGSELMRVTDTGNVGIGIPWPSAKLDVNGDAIVRGPLYLSASDCRIGVYPPAVSHPPFLAFYSDQTQEGGYAAMLVAPQTAGADRYRGGFMVANWNDGTPDMHVRPDGWVIAKSGFYPLSDDRIKINERKLESGLALVMALTPKRYDRMEWGFDPETEELIFYPEKISRTNEIGLVAQEVQQVIPEAVGAPEDENRELWALSYDNIVPVLVKAIQEQQAQIDALKKEIKALKPGT